MKVQYTASLLQCDMKTHAAGSDIKGDIKHFFVFYA